MSAELRIQRAQPQHLEAMLDLRMALFAEGGVLGDQEAAVRQANRAYFAQHLDDDMSVTWVVLAHGEVVSCGSLAFWRRAPHPQNLLGIEAYLLNMMTLPAWRRKGAARMVVQAALDEARARGCQRVCLHASADGRDLYQQCGFTASPPYMEACL